jgi:nitrogenase molybdenum-iron protein NifN
MDYLTVLLNVKIKSEVMLKQEKTFTSTRNACKVCSPLGASVAFKGIKGCVPLIHGSQGCSTYIRRYLISHYKEPVDLASSNFSQDSTIFGGKQNISTGLDNIIHQYDPEVIAIATTCLSETIGEDIPMLIDWYKSQNSDRKLPYLIHASTPSYRGTHIDGFHEAVLAAVVALAEKEAKGKHLNIFPGFVSPEDLRYLKEIFRDFDQDFIMLPDYSDTLDNPHWSEYQKIPQGGTSVEQIKRTGSAAASIEFGHILNKGNLPGRITSKSVNPSAGEYLEKEFGVKRYQLGMPIGIKLSDKFFDALEDISGVEMPDKYRYERGRLIDAYIDGHKYVFGKRAIVYGEEDFVLGLVSFLDEIGIETVLCATGGESGQMASKIREITGKSDLTVCSPADFETISTLSKELNPDIIIGNSKGYYIARELEIPIVRVGFPIHDRMGGQRILHLAYRGAQQLFDSIANALIEYKQNHSPVGYKYM